MNKMTDHYAAFSKYLLPYHWQVGLISSFPFFFSSVTKVMPALMNLHTSVDSEEQMATEKLPHPALTSGQTHPQKRWHCVKPSGPYPLHFAYSHVILRMLPQALLLLPVRVATIFHIIILGAKILRYLSILPATGLSLLK